MCCCIRLPQLAFVSLFAALSVTSIVSIPAQETNALPWSANPALVEKLSGKRTEFNYDETKVPTFTLPDPLLTSDGTAITTSQQWHDIRRPELMELFREQVYGRRPDTAYTIRFEETSKNEDALEGTAVCRQMKAVLTIDKRLYSFPFTVVIPKKTAGKVPAVVLINNRDFMSLEEAVGPHDPFWPVRTLIDRGYATATFFTTNVDPDRADGYAAGVRSFFASGEAPADNAWRSLSAWGWAASRVLDYLETVDQVDASRVALVGHSRGGKTALWAASEDTRFAIAYSNNSGCGGAALSRRAYGETVARITSSFPHWFTPNFAKFAGRENELPVDQHQLMSLIAPRALYVTSADEDLWADPKGEYASLVAASPVFQLLGVKSITTPEMPVLNEAVIVGKTGYHIRAGEHDLKQFDWDKFLDFADTIVK
jgi:hypothetical protein